MPPLRQLSFTAGAGVVAAQAQKASWYQGDDVLMTFTMSPVVNISGWVILYSQKNRFGGTLESLHAATVTDGPNGIFTVLQPGSDTLNAAAFDGHVAEVRRTDSGAQTVLAGLTINLLAGVNAVAGPAPQAAASFSVVPSTNTPSLGVPFSVVVTALDAFGQTVLSYPGPISLTCSDQLASVAAAGPLVDGVQLFSVTLQTPGTQTFTATGN